jgi:dihydrodipicolinate synthase/N-acetylneuraminate lyase
VDLSHHRTIGGNRPDPAQYLDQTLELTEYARSRGAAAGVLVVPSALLPGRGMTLEETVFNYYETVSKSSQLPVFIYNTPGLPNEYNTTRHMAARVSRLDNVLGMKLSTVDMQWMTEIAMAASGTDFVLIAGSECTFYHALLSGACGVIGQGCDVNPEILRGLFDRFMALDLAGALEAQRDALRALYLFEGLNAPQAGLAYLKRKGVETQGYGPFGEPPVPAAEIERIEDDLDRLIAKYRA